MKIAHFAPFVPSRSGMYEAAADMVKADCIAGHDARFVDTGLPEAGQAASAGQVNKRGDFILTTVDQTEVRDADVIVAHTGIPDGWIVGTEAPIIWILHGRPRDCFLTELGSAIATRSLALFQTVAGWPRTRRLITMWPEHLPYWQTGLPAAKVELIDALPIDRERFQPAGPVHQFPDELCGEFNVLISDAWRSDTDIFSTACAACRAAEQVPGLRVHFISVAFDETTGRAAPVCEWFFQRLRDLGALGEVHGRINDMPELYRAMDAVITPHSIATRTVVEPLCCGTAVVAAPPCGLTPYTAVPHDLEAVAAQIVRVIGQIKERGRVTWRQEFTKRTAHGLTKFSLDVFGTTMNAVYERALAGEPSPTGARTESASLPDSPGSPSQGE